MATDNKNKFIGSGYIFPIVLNSFGRPEPLSDVRLIYASLRTLFYWPKNTRFFIESFGCRIEDLLEEPNDSIARSLLNTFIKEAVQDYEKRIIVNTVTVKAVSPIKIEITVKFYLRNSKIEETFIFPYYKELN